MARPCSQDLRDRVLASVDDGMSSGEVAELFQVDVSYVYSTHSVTAALRILGRC
jgi:transposase